MAWESWAEGNFGYETKKVVVQPQPLELNEEGDIVIQNTNIRPIMENGVIKKSINKTGWEVVSATLKPKNTQPNPETTQEINKLREELNTKFTIDNASNTLDTINKLKDPQEKILLTNFLFSAMWSRWFHVTLKWEKVEIISSSPNKIDFETLINNRLDLETTRQAILYKTDSLKWYIVSNTDAKWKLNTTDAKNYYDYLVKKYDISWWLIWICVKDIKWNDKIPKNDQDFMISFIEKWFDWVKINESLKQLQDKEKEVKLNIAAMPPEVKADLEQKTKFIDDRSVDERCSDFLKNPFWEINLIMWKAWWIGWLAILWAIIYGMFKYPKQIFWAIAWWWLAKWLWVMDMIWNTVEWEYNDTIKRRAKSAAKWVSEAYSFTKEQTEKFIEKRCFWWDYSNIEFDNKDIIKSSFKDVYSKCNKDAKTDVSKLDDLKNSLRHKKSPTVDDSDIIKLNTRIITIHNEWVQKFRTEDAFNKAIAWKSIDETLAIIVKWPDTPVTWSENKPNQNEKVILDKLVKLEQRIDNDDKSITWKELSDYLKTKMKYLVDIKAWATLLSGWSGKIRSMPTDIKKWNELLEDYKKAEKIDWFDDYLLNNYLLDVLDYKKLKDVIALAVLDLWKVQPTLPAQSTPTLVQPAQPLQQVQPGVTPPLLQPVQPTPPTQSTTPPARPDINLWTPPVIQQSRADIKI